MDRLREADLNTERFVDLRDGTKTSYRDHTLPQNQFSIEDLEGEYGIMAGNGLVILDIDSYRDSIDRVPDSIEDLPDTFTVRTPHGGEHRYFVIEGDICNTNAEWGEVRAQSQYVVGPGSQLDDCDKDWHDCAKLDEGLYTTLHNNPIVRITAEELRSRLNHTDETQGTARYGNGRSGKLASSEPEATPDELDFTDIEADFDVQARWEKLLNSERGETVKNLRDGRYRDAGYVAGDGSGDRSEAEYALLEHLGWWMNDQRAVIAEMMNRICLAKQQTDGGRRKWLERNDEYRESVLNDVSDHTRTYESAADWPTAYGEDRPTVGGPIRNRVVDALLDLGVARTTELVEHPRVDRSKRQVRRTLNQLMDAEQVNSTADPEDRRQVLYYPTIHEPNITDLIEDRD